jgi:diacylglycerol kinase
MRSFLFAFAGIWHAVRTERNFRIHIAAVFYVVIAGVLLYFNAVEWMAVALVCGLIAGAELVNTALERLCDGLEPGNSAVVKVVKDLAAGAVLVCAVAVSVVAVILAWEVWQWGVAFEDFPARPAFWAGAAALPFWLWFVFGFGRKKP